MKLHTIRLLVLAALAFAGGWEVQKDVSRYLDQRDNALKLDYAWKQAKFVLEQSKVRCEGP